MALFSTLFFYAEHKRSEGEDNLAAKAVEEVLSSQNRALAQRVEDRFLKADTDASEADKRWKKKPKFRSFFTDTSLAEPGAPKWVIIGGKRIRAAGNLDNALLEDALEAHLSGPKRSALHLSKGKYYLFVRGTADGQSYASAYLPEEFFSDLRSREGIRDWLALGDGTVLFHPLHRFIGSSGANMRPVSAGMQELAAGKTATFTQRYLGLEGREAFAAWSTLPEFGLLAASEWPKDPARASQSSFLFWLALVAALGSCFSAGLSLRPPEAAPREADFDFGRLDKDAVEYVESVKASAERAVNFAKAREGEAGELKRELALRAADLQWAEWRYDLLDQVQRKLLHSSTGKQVWEEIAALFAERLPGIAIGFYRYSPSSFSLVPESVFTQADLPDSALAFLRDARIFIGNLSYLPKLGQTEAFQKWNRGRERHMPLHQTEFRFFPLLIPGGGRGLLMVIFDRRMNESGELSEGFDLLAGMIQRVGSFCERLPALLQSSNAKGSTGPSVASAPNEARNRPRPS